MSCGEKFARTEGPGLLQDSEIEQAMGEQGDCSPSHVPALEYGERCWRISGDMFDVVIWDVGNGWSVVQQVILPSCHPRASIVEHFAPSFDYAGAYRELARFFGQLARNIERGEKFETAERLEPGPQPQEHDHPCERGESP